MITVLEMGAARHFLRTQQMARSTEERAQILQPTLEINAGYRRGNGGMEGRGISKSMHFICANP
jgi:hypothetical protein